MYRQESPTRACRCRTFKDFGNKTSFHGVQYIVREDGGIFEKLLWTTIILLGAAGSSYMTHQVWMRFASSPIRISIYSTQRPTTTIPFPAITICPAVRLVPAKIDALLEKLTLPSNISKGMVREALPSLLAYSQNVPFEQEHLNLLDVVFRLNKYPIEQIFADIEPSCQDLLLKCKWEKDTLPCDQLFRTSLTKDGHCCSFNLRSRKNPNFRPLRTVYFGVQLGLSLIIDPGVSKPQESHTTLSSSGIKLLVHGNYDLPGTFSTEKILANASENLVRISASKLKSSSNVKSLTFEQRKCVISEEKKLKYFSLYRTINCELECKMDRILNHCGCMPYRFLVNNKPVCNISNISCVRKYSTIYSFKIQENSGTLNNDSKWIYPCDCPPKCTDVMYRIHTTSIPLAQPPNVVSSFYRTNLGEEYLKKLVVHIYLASQFQEEMLRDTVTSIYNVFSSLGGIFGIFLGCSFLSILEIIYYFCYRIFKHHNDHHGW